MNESAPPTLRILGTRGIPAAHGGFETFAEQLALYLVQHGWRVVVYCQVKGPGKLREDTWRSVERVIVPVAGESPAATILFDWQSLSHAARYGDLCLTLGYNTAVLSAWLRLKGVPNVFNMDGVEWRRPKWSSAVKFWFWMNDWAACWLGNHLIADHPQIARHLESRVAASKISTIAYGAPRLSNIDDTAIRKLGLTPRRYLTVIARAEPENSLLEIVKGFSQRRRNVTLAVLGHYHDHHPYHAAVRAAASDEVVFLGAIYDKATVAALRFHCLAYLHGHQVGGTNPSLVEALGAANAVIAHDNRFNRWVAGSGAKYFNGGEDLSALLDDVLDNPTLLAQMRAASIERFETDFTLDTILTQYRTLLESWLPSTSGFAALQPRAQVNKSNS